MKGFTTQNYEVRGDFLNFIFLIVCFLRNTVRFWLAFSEEPALVHIALHSLP